MDVQSIPLVMDLASILYFGNFVLVVALGANREGKSCYLQLNIFLAILVDGYMAVRVESEENKAKGMIPELFHLLKHEAQRLVRFIFPRYPFVSDEEICERISQRLHQTRSSSIVGVHKVICDFHKISLSSMYQINLSSGERVNMDTMFSILKDLNLLNVPSLTQNFQSNTTDSVSETYINAALRDVMFRYGAPFLPDESETRTEQNRCLIEVTKLDAMKQLTQMHLDSLKTSIFKGDEPAQNDAEQSWNSKRKKLCIALEKARNLPKMDFGRGVDLFCAIFVEGCPGLKQTQILRGVSESDWTWGADAQFEWDLGEITPAKDFRRNIVVMAYDKDQVSADDLIGCVKISLSELEHGALDEWREIIRPQNAFFSSSISQRKVKPELKFRASLTAPWKAELRTAKSGQELVSNVISGTISY